MRLSLIAPALTAAALVVATTDAGAQCCPTPTVAYSPVVAPAPTVAYSPVVAAAPAPVVQTTTVNNGWYPGKYLTDFTRSLFGGNRTTTTYTAGYAPTAYTAGYAPTAYTSGYAPVVASYSAGYAPISQVAYRPTYPVTYGAVQTVSRPVVLSPIATAPVCDACSACSSVSQAAYAAPSSSCSSCQPAQHLAPSPTPAEPQPALGPAENPARDRGFDAQRPQIEVDEFDNYDSVLEQEGSADDGLGDAWPLQAPPLFQAPANRITAKRHPAPVRTAVYRRSSGEVQRVTPTSATEPRSVRRLSGAGWASAAE